MCVKNTDGCQQFTSLVQFVCVSIYYEFGYLKIMSQSFNLNGFKTCLIFLM